MPKKLYDLRKKSFVVNQNYYNYEDEFAPYKINKMLWDKDKLERERNKINKFFLQGINDIKPLWVIREFIHYKFKVFLPLNPVNYNAKINYT